MTSGGREGESWAGGGLEEEEEVVVVDEEGVRATPPGANSPEGVVGMSELGDGVSSNGEKTK